MTAYSVYSDYQTDTSKAPTHILLTVGLYEIRVASVTFISISNTPASCGIFRLGNPVITGGTKSFARSLRDGAPATAAFNTLFDDKYTYTGQSLINKVLVPSGSTATWFNTPATYNGSSSQYDSPMTTTFAPGEGLLISNLGFYVNATVFFEELRLPGSYT